jgi:steroid delta-isomerase-like uncharacterized protein
VAGTLESLKEDRMIEQREEVAGVIDRMVAVMNQHDLDGCVGFYSPDAELQDPRFPDPVRGSEYVREGFSYWFSAFPDVRITVNRMIIDGRDVAVEWTFDATHQGEYMGVPPSGKAFSVTTAAHFQVEKGQVIRDFSLFDATGIRTLEELAGVGGSAAQ